VCEGDKSETERIESSFHLQSHFDQLECHFYGYTAGDSVNSEQESIIYNIRSWDGKCRRTKKSFLSYIFHFQGYFIVFIFQLFYFNFTAASHLWHLCDASVRLKQKTRNDSYRSTFSMPCSNSTHMMSRDNTTDLLVHTRVKVNVCRCRLKSWRESDEMSHYFISI
jgi:hypothetical protein